MLPTPAETVYSSAVFISTSSSHLSAFSRMIFGESLSSRTMWKGRALIANRTSTWSPFPSAWISCVFVLGWYFRWSLWACYWLQNATHGACLSYPIAYRTELYKLRIDRMKGAFGDSDSLHGSKIFRCEAVLMMRRTLPLKDRAGLSKTSD